MSKYTEEQIERAKNVNVQDFLQKTEHYFFDIGRNARYIKCQSPQKTGQPSSLSIDLELNRIYYNSVTGNRPLSALDWCMMVRNMDFQSAMKMVINEEPNGDRTEISEFAQYKPKVYEKEEKKELILPEKADNSKNVYMYLTKTRGIATHIVNSCIQQNLIYQDNRKNAVFVGVDDDNQPKYATRRGTLSFEGIEPFKRDCKGSDKNFAFKLVGKNTDTIYVTEAAIDALSLATLEDKFNGKGAYENKTYISTGSAGIDSAIDQFCKTHDVKTINICFDNDNAGKNGAEKIMWKYRMMGYTVNDMRASLAHDYNDELTEYNKNPDFYSEPPSVVRNNTNTERNDIMPEQEIKTNDFDEQQNKRSNQINEDDITPKPDPKANEQKTAAPSAVTFGNTAYEKIPDKEAILDIDPLAATNLINRLQNEQINFLGKMTQKGMVVIVSKKDVEKVSEIVNEEMNRLHKENTVQKEEPKTEREEVRTETMPEVNNNSAQKETSEQSIPQEKAVKFTEEQLEQMNPEAKMNFLLASMKDKQEKRRSKALDKIDRIDGSISRQQERIERLEAKVKDIESSLKTSMALKRAFGNTALGGLIDKSIEKKHKKIAKIRDKKIPKREQKIQKKSVKKAKVNVKLGKINGKIDRIDKTQQFLTAAFSKDREGFVTGLENLTDIRREKIENKIAKNNEKIISLTEKFKSGDLSHTERHEIIGKVESLKEKNAKLEEKIGSMQKLHEDLTEIRNGSFTESDIDKALNKTAEKISERLESNNVQEENGMLANIVDNFIESGSEAITEVKTEKAIEQNEKTNSELVRERQAEEREPDVTQNTERQILNVAAVITGIDISELNRLPAEIKAEIVAEFIENNGNIPTEQLAEKICDIAEINPPIAMNKVEQTISNHSEQTGNDKENPLRQLEEMIEDNDNYIDGMINNISSDKAEKNKSKTILGDEPMFSRSKVMSDDFKPTSSKSNEDIERSKTHRNEMEI